MKKSLFKILNYLNLFGFHPVALTHLPKFSRFLREKQAFSNAGGVITTIFPVFSDYESNAGSHKGHYFHQDLVVAQQIYSKNPKKHLDIGSRIDGFVAHVATFRQIDVLDVRDLTQSEHPNIRFRQVDLMQEGTLPIDFFDSISCLHAIEHFGLGRYGDQIDPSGHHKGFVNLISMLEIGGDLYLSFPIGLKNETHFNAHRVFHPLDILNWPECGEKLILNRFDYVDDAGNLHTNTDLLTSPPQTIYGCGIYSFTRI
jgi:hypothetical protein